MIEQLRLLIGQPKPYMEILNIDGINQAIYYGYDLEYITLAILTIAFVIGLFNILSTFQKSLSNKRMRG